MILINYKTANGPGRDRTDDFEVNSFTLYLLSYKTSQIIQNQTGLFLEKSQGRSSTDQRCMYAHTTIHLQFSKD
jgi:hypothetical protein